MYLSTYYLPIPIGTVAVLALLLCLPISQQHECSMDKGTIQKEHLSSVERSGLCKTQQAVTEVHSTLALRAALCLHGSITSMSRYRLVSESLAVPEQTGAAYGGTNTDMPLDSITYRYRALLAANIYVGTVYTCPVNSRLTPQASKANQWHIFIHTCSKSSSPVSALPAARQVPQSLKCR